MIKVGTAGRKIDRYRTAKCPKCGKFMDKVGNWWRCTNPECSVTRLKTEEVVGEVGKPSTTVTMTMEL